MVSKSSKNILLSPFLNFLSLLYTFYTGLSIDFLKKNAQIGNAIFVQNFYEKTLDFWLAMWYNISERSECGGQ